MKEGSAPVLTPNPNIYFGYNRNRNRSCVKTPVGVKRLWCEVHNYKCGYLYIMKEEKTFPGIADLEVGGFFLMFYLLRGGPRRRSILEWDAHW